jgi:hypothetical protein
VKYACFYEGSFAKYNHKLREGIEEIISNIEQLVLLAGGEYSDRFFTSEFREMNFKDLAKSRNDGMLMMKGLEHRIDACLPLFPTLATMLCG